MGQKCKSCVVGANNTGFKKEVDFGPLKFQGYMRLVADDGTINEIDCTDLTQAKWDILVNLADRSKAIYPSSEFDDVVDVRADASFQTTGSGKNKKLRDGNRNFAGNNFGRGPVYLGQLEAFQCEKWGVIEIDTCENIRGLKSANAGFVKPEPIEMSSWNPQLIKGDDGTVQGVSLSFDYTASLQDKDLRGLDGDNHTVDLTDPTGLIPVTAVNDTPTATGVEMTMTTDYGDCADVDEVTTLLVADWTATNITTGTPVDVPVLTAPQTAPGVYALTWSTVGSGQIMVITSAKDGLYWTETFTTA